MLHCLQRQFNQRISESLTATNVVVNALQKTVVLLRLAYTSFLKLLHFKNQQHRNKSTSSLNLTLEPFCFTVTSQVLLYTK